MLDKFEASIVGLFKGLFLGIVFSIALMAVISSFFVIIVLIPSIVFKTELPTINPDLILEIMKYGSFIITYGSGLYGLIFPNEFDWMGM